MFESRGYVCLGAQYSPMKGLLTCIPTWSPHVQGGGGPFGIRCYTVLLQLKLLEQVVVDTNVVNWFHFLPVPKPWHTGNFVFVLEQYFIYLLTFTLFSCYSLIITQFLSEGFFL